jgi:hypothetical protein
MCKCQLRRMQIAFRIAEVSGVESTQREVPLVVPSEILDAFPCYLVQCE